MDYIKPELPGGFKDYLPEDMIPRQKMFDTIRATFELFGFLPLDTPGIEREEVLTGGDPGFNKQLYRAGLDGSKDKLALRFDLTVPLARVVAANFSNLKKPFKRYHTGKVWRGERQQAGRYREFVQFDADIVGSASPMADAEIIALMQKTMEALRVPNFLIKVNSRKILNGLPEYAGYDTEKNTVVLRTIDKLDKQSWELVAAELSEEADLNDDQIQAVKNFIDIKKDSPAATLNRLKELMSNSKVALEGIDDLEKVSSNINALGVPSNSWTVDLSVARGLGYYTGIVFETILKDLPAMGSVFSGGRYDDLIARFGPNSLPAVGASVGVDRLFAALTELDIVARTSNVAQVLILNFEENCQQNVQRVAGILRDAKIPTEIYLGSENTLKGQLAYAVKQEYDLVVIIGSNEKEKDTVVLKNLKSREQKEMLERDLVPAIKSLV